MLLGTCIGCIGTNEKENDLDSCNSEFNETIAQEAKNSETTEIETLIQELDKGTHENKIRTAKTLGEKGEVAADQLIQTVNENLERSRTPNAYALLALTETGDERTSEILESVMKSKVNEEAFAETSDEMKKQHTEEFTRTLEEKDLQQRAAIARWVSLEKKDVEKEEMLDRLLLDGEEDTDKYAEIALEGTNFSEIEYEEKIDMLSKALSAEEAYVRISAAMALGYTGNEEAIEPLAKMLPSKNLGIRNSAAMSLGYIGNEKAVAYLLLSGREEWKSSNGFVIALGKIGDKRAVPDLIMAIRRTALVHTEDELQSNAILALGNIGDRRAVPILLEILNRYGQNGKVITRDCDEDPAVRRHTILALGEIGDENATETLIGILNGKEEEEETRKCAALALGEIKDERAVETLVEVLGNESESILIRDQAALALGKIGNEKATKAIIPYLKDPELGDSSREALAHIGETAVELLIECLSGGDEALKTEAALLLIEIGDERAVEPLIQAYE